VQVRDPVTGERVGVPWPTGHRVDALAVADVDGLLAVLVLSERTLEVCDSTGEPTGAGLAVATGTVTSIAGGRLDGRALAVAGCVDGAVRAWYLDDGTAIAPLLGHTGPVGAVAVGMFDGRTVIASGGDDGTVRLWDPGTGAAIGAPRAVPHRIRCVAVGSDPLGRDLLLAGDHTGGLHWWDAGRAGHVDLTAAVNSVVVSVGRAVAGTDHGIVCVEL
jgi:WD40 repeat protein